MPKRMRLPNGFGQISKLKQRLRNPYRAMVTDHWDKETGKPIRKIIGYYKSYNEAYEALIDFHRAPSEKYKDATVKELYDMWINEQVEKKDITPSVYNVSFRRCRKLHDMKVSEVRSFHIKEAVEAEMPPSAHSRLHQLLNMMFDFAVQYSMTDQNYSRLALPFYDATKSKNHISFTHKEIKILKENITYPYVDIMLIGIYTGFRPNELLKIEWCNVNITEWTIIGGSKTEAGKNRCVPIHPEIRELVKKRYEESSGEYLFNGVTYNSYKYKFDRLMSKLTFGDEHNPHDTRKTFITLAKEYNVNEYAIKRIVGHTIADLTESVYTDRPISFLSSEVEKIPTVDLL